MCRTLIILPFLPSGQHGGTLGWGFGAGAAASVRKKSKLELELLLPQSYILK